MGARASRNRADAAVGGDGEKKQAAFLMQSGPVRTIGGGDAMDGGGRARRPSPLTDLLVSS